MTDETMIALEFPSSYQWLNMIDLVCGEVTSEMGFSKNALNEISISVIEACTNALEEMIPLNCSWRHWGELAAPRTT